MQTHGIWKRKDLAGGRGHTRVQGTDPQSSPDEIGQDPDCVKQLAEDTNSAKLKPAERIVRQQREIEERCQTWGKILRTKHACRCNRWEAAKSLTSVLTWLQRPLLTQTTLTSLTHPCFAFFTALSHFSHTLQSTYLATHLSTPTVSKRETFICLAVSPTPRKMLGKWQAVNKCAMSEWRDGTDTDENGINDWEENLEIIPMIAAGKDKEIKES